MKKWIQSLVAAIFTVTSVYSPAAFAVDPTTLTLPPQQQAPTTSPSTSQTTPSTTTTGSQTSTDFVAAQAPLSQAPTLPEGWTQAASNANYGFKVEPETYQYTYCTYTYTSQCTNYLRTRLALKVLDATTGNSQKLIDNGDASASLFSISSIRDISSDATPGGAVAVFALDKKVFAGEDGIVTLRRVANPAETLSINGKLKSAQFSADGSSAKIEIVGQDTSTGFSDIYEIDLKTLKITAQYLKALSGTVIPKDADTSLVVLTDKISTSPSIALTFRVRIYDASMGDDQIRLIDTFDAGSDYSATGGFTLKDAYLVPGGQKIVSVGAQTKTSTLSPVAVTIIRDIETGEQLKLEGSAESFTYEGTLAKYVLRDILGNKRQVTVNLTTLREVPALSYAYLASEAQNPSQPGLDAFMAFLTSKGITQFSRAEIEALTPIPTGAVSPTVGVDYYVTTYGDQVAIGVKGQIFYYKNLSCSTLPGGSQHCIPVNGATMGITKVLLKTSPAAQGVTINLGSNYSFANDGIGPRMGFTIAGELYLAAQFQLSEIYNSNGTVKATLAGLAILAKSVTKAGDFATYTVINTAGKKQRVVVDLATNEVVADTSPTAPAAIHAVMTTNTDGSFKLTVSTTDTQGVPLRRIYVYNSAGILKQASNSVLYSVNGIEKETTIQYFTSGKLSKVIHYINNPNGTIAVYTDTRYDSTGKVIGIYNKAGKKIG